MALKDLFIKPSDDAGVKSSKDIGGVNEALSAFKGSEVQASEPTKEPVEGVVGATEIYQWAELPEKASTIYTVQAFVKSLPTTMDMDTKRQSLDGILKAAQLDAGALAEDAEERIGALMRYAADIEASTQAELQEDKEKIETMLAEIEATKIKMRDAGERLDEQLKVIKAEQEVIQEIVAHI